MTNLRCLILNSIIIYETNTINKSYNKFISVWIDLHCGNIAHSLLPINDFPLIDIPNTNHPIKASRNNIVLWGWFNEQSRAKDIRVLKNLYRFIKVYIPDNYKTISTHREQVWWGWVFGTPIDLEYIRLMKVVPFFDWFGLE